MPYIEAKRRADLSGDYRDAPANAGELNYVITTLLLEYAIRDGQTRYALLNDCLGALEGAKLEFYRRVVVPYETKKIAENGDVYPPIQVGTTARLSPKNQELYDAIYGK